MIRKPRPLTLPGIGTYSAKLDDGGHPYIYLAYTAGLLPCSGYSLFNREARRMEAWLTTYNAWAAQTIKANAARLGLKTKER